MKRHCFSIVVIFIYCLAFGNFSAISADRSDVTIYPEVSGSFTAVKVGGEFRVIYSNSSDTLKIIAGDKVIPNIECRLDDRTLIVGYREGNGVKAVFGGKSPVVYIPADPQINEIVLSGTTHLECAAPIVSENLSLLISGAARVIGEIKTSTASIRCAGAANVTITGSSDLVDIRIDGASRVAMGEGFESRRGNVNVNGAGIVRINCSEKITGEISGSSVIKYLGKPELAIITNGLASVSAVD